MNDKKFFYDISKIDREASFYQKRDYRILQKNEDFWILFYKQKTSTINR